MTQSSGQMDAPICSTCCKSLESSQRHAGTDCHAARMTGRNTSNATHAALLKRLHPCAAASSLRQRDKYEPHDGDFHDWFAVANVFVLPFHLRLLLDAFLVLPRCRMRGHEIDRFRILFGRYFPRIGSV